MSLKQKIDKFLCNHFGHNDIELDCTESITRKVGTADWGKCTIYIGEGVQENYKVKCLRCSRIEDRVRIYSQVDNIRSRRIPDMWEFERLNLRKFTGVMDENVTEHICQTHGEPIIDFDNGRCACCILSKVEVDD